MNSRLEDAPLSFSSNWFHGHLPNWFWLLNEHIDPNGVLRVLEIGSWEGQSTLFFLRQFPRATVTAVDTWKGSPENNGTAENLRETFDKNTTKFSNRLEVKQTTSANFFSTNKEQFDLIYVDGSHFAPDVLLDAINSWRSLRDGGVVVFDDFLWNYYPNPSDNPMMAISLFLKLVWPKYRILHCDYQIMLEKIPARGVRL